eukprot:8138778-Pyramimonas_sp.AAC.1
MHQGYVMPVGRPPGRHVLRARNVAAQLTPCSTQRTARSCASIALPTTSKTPQTSRMLPEEDL